MHGQRPGMSSENLLVILGLDETNSRWILWVCFAPGLWLGLLVLIVVAKQGLSISEIVSQ